MQIYCTIYIYYITHTHEDSNYKIAIKNDEFAGFRVKPVQSLFNGIVKMSANMSDVEVRHGSSRSQCLIQPSDQEQCDEDLKSKLPSHRPGETLSILDELLELGNNGDFAPFIRLTLEDNEIVEEDRRRTSNR